VPAVRHPDPPRPVHEPLVVLLPALPAAAAEALTGRHLSGTLGDGRIVGLIVFTVCERLPMAKALLGHVNSDVRTTAVLAVENRRLRRRVEDLEALTLRLQADNDRLAAAAREAARTADDLQPA
jgi:hypothetical protein